MHYALSVVLRCVLGIEGLACPKKGRPPVSDERWQVWWEVLSTNLEFARACRLGQRRECHPPVQVLSWEGSLPQLWLPRVLPGPAPSAVLMTVSQPLAPEVVEVRAPPTPQNTISFTTISGVHWNEFHSFAAITSKVTSETRTATSVSIR